MSALSCPRRIAFTVEIAPLGSNHGYAPAKWGRRIGFRKTDEAAQYQGRIRAAATMAMEGAKPIAGQCSVSLLFVFPANRGDIDGPIKLALDAMQGVVYANDRQVRPLHVDRGLDRQRPRIEIEVTEVVAQRVTGEAALMHDMLTRPSPAKRERTNASRLRSSVRRP